MCPGFRPNKQYGIDARSSETFRKVYDTIRVFSVNSRQLEATSHKTWATTCKIPPFKIKAGIKNDNGQAFKVKTHQYQNSFSTLSLATAKKKTHYVHTPSVAKLLWYQHAFTLKTWHLTRLDYADFDPNLSEGCQADQEGNCSLDFLRFGFWQADLLERIIPNPRFHFQNNADK